MRYSLPAISNTCTTNLRVIQSAQAQALRACLGLPRCASTVGTICIAQEHPIATYVATETLRLYIRLLTRLPSHHLAQLPQSRPRSTFSAIITTHRAEIPSRYAPAATPTSPLWCLAQPEIRLSVPGIRKKADLSSLALQQLTLLLLHERYNDRKHVYTDGSVTSSSSAGAMFVPADFATTRFRVCHTTSSSRTCSHS